MRFVLILLMSFYYLNSFGVRREQSISGLIEITPVLNLISLQKGSDYDNKYNKFYNRNIKPSLGICLQYSYENLFNIELGWRYTIKMYGIKQYIFGKSVDKKSYVVAKWYTLTREIPINIMFPILTHFQTSYKIFIVSGISFDRYRIQSNYIGHKLNNGVNALSYSYGLLDSLNYEKKFNGISVEAGIVLKGKFKKNRKFELGISYHHDFYNRQPAFLQTTLNYTNNNYAVITPRFWSIRFSFKYYLFEKKIL